MAGQYKNHKNRQRGVDNKDFYFADGADDLFYNGFKFSIVHVPSGDSVQFKAFITAFNDTYAQDWNSEQVFGRADPLYNFKQTTRRISFGFKMPAASENEAYANLAKAQKLAQFMYPNYTDVDGAKVLSQGPLLRLKIMNLAQSTTRAAVPKGTKPTVLYNSYDSGGEGILGFFSDVTFNFNLENSDHGAFQFLDNEGAPKKGTILPKLIEVSVGGFNPIHEGPLGWDANNNFGKLSTDDQKDTSLFPYGAQGDPKGGGVDAVGGQAPSKGMAKARQDYKDERAAASAREKARLEKEKAEAAIANAEARYGGMFGDARRKRDDRRMTKGKYKGSKKEYIASALAGKFGIDSDYLDDGLDTSEVKQINSIYDGYVKD